MEKYLETERLYLRTLRPEDAGAIYAYRNDRRCYEYQRWEDTSMAAVRAFVEKFGQSVFLSEQEEQHFAVCAGNVLAGDLTYFYNEEENCVTLGITISPEHQRRGYAREILRAVIEATQRRYPKLDIVALIHRANGASIALFEKLGFYRECYAESIGSHVYVIEGK